MGWRCKCSIWKILHPKKKKIARASKMQIQKRNPKYNDKEKNWVVTSLFRLPTKRAEKSSSNTSCDFDSS